MFTIGEFSRIARVTARQLRHYEALGLFKPERIDPETGYRSYSALQLPRMNRILLTEPARFKGHLSWAERKTARGFAARWWLEMFRTFQATKAVGGWKLIVVFGSCCYH